MPENALKLDLQAVCRGNLQSPAGSLTSHKHPPVPGKVGNHFSSVVFYLGVLGGARS